MQGRLRVYEDDYDYENIRAAVVIGSRARTDHPADDWADLDILILAEDPTPVWQRTDWIDSLGEVWLTFVEPVAVGSEMERRVLFAGGYDVDFAPLPMASTRSLIGSPLPPATAEVIRRGVRILLDKDGLAGQLLNALPRREGNLPYLRGRQDKAVVPLHGLICQPNAFQRISHGRRRIISASSQAESHLPSD